MQIYIPYTHPCEEVITAVVDAGYEPNPVDVSESDDAYFELLRHLWSVGDSFGIVEHDVVVRDDSLTILEECESPWCAFTFEYARNPIPGLGCVKFTADIIARNPTAMDEVAAMWDETHLPRHWCRLDAWLQQHVLPDHGEKQCVHTPPLRHLREGGPMRTSHGCGCSVTVIALVPEYIHAMNLSLLAMHQPKGGINFALAHGPDSGNQSVRRYQKEVTEEWKRLVIWDVGAVIPALDAIKRHGLTTQPVVASTLEDGVVSFDLMSFSREVIDEWPDFPEPLDGNNISRMAWLAQQRGYEAVADTAMRVMPVPGRQSSSILLPGNGRPVGSRPGRWARQAH